MMSIQGSVMCSAIAIQISRLGKLAKIAGMGVSSQPPWLISAY